MDEYQGIKGFEAFQDSRICLREYGVQRLKEELITTGFVDRESEMLTVGMQPFNVFARIASGIMAQPSMVEDQAKLGAYQDRYMIACNRPECDEMWQSSDPAWVGKASMSQKHRLLLVKDLHWEWFNALTYGLVSSLPQGIKKLEEMREAGLLYTKSSEGWPPEDQIGMFLHVYAHCSVNSMHLHILDMSHLGPSYKKQEYKNLSIDDAIAVLKAELADSSGTAQ